MTSRCVGRHGHSLWWHTVCGAAGVCSTSQGWTADGQGCCQHLPMGIGCIHMAPLSTVTCSKTAHAQHRDKGRAHIKGTGRGDRLHDVHPSQSRCTVCCGPDCKAQLEHTAASHSPRHMLRPEQSWPCPYCPWSGRTLSGQHAVRPMVRQYIVGTTCHAQAVHRWDNTL